MQDLSRAKIGGLQLAARGHLLASPASHCCSSQRPPLVQDTGEFGQHPRHPEGSLARSRALALPAPCACLTHPHAGVRQRQHGPLEPKPMVIRPPGQALRLTAAYSHLSSMVMAEKLSPRLGLGQGPELKLLVSYGGHFDQVRLRVLSQAPAGLCITPIGGSDCFEALLKSLWRAR